MGTHRKNRIFGTLTHLQKIVPQFLDQHRQDIVRTLLDLPSLLIAELWMRLATKVGQEQRSFLANSCNLVTDCVFDDLNGLDKGFTFVTEVSVEQVIFNCRDTLLSKSPRSRENLTNILVAKHLDHWLCNGHFLRRNRLSAFEFFLRDFLAGSVLWRLIVAATSLLVGREYFIINVTGILGLESRRSV